MVLGEVAVEDIVGLLIWEELHDHKRLHSKHERQESGLEKDKEVLSSSARANGNMQKEAVIWTPSSLSNIA